MENVVMRSSEAHIRQLAKLKLHVGAITTVMSSTIVIVPPNSTGFVKRQKFVTVRLAAVSGKEKERVRMLIQI